MWPHVQPLPGTVKLITHLHANKIPIAIATGTRRRNLALKTSHLGYLIDCFDGHIVCADDGKIASERGKPCPDLFLVAARELLGRPVGTGEQSNANDAETRERAKGIVFEDAIPGVEAGKRAGMNGTCSFSLFNSHSVAVLLLIYSLDAVVWIPDSNLLEVEYSGLHKADEILLSADEFDPANWGLPPYPSLPDNEV